MDGVCFLMVLPWGAFALACLVTIELWDAIDAKNRIICWQGTKIASLEKELAAKESQINAMRMFLHEDNEDEDVCQDGAASALDDEEDD